MSIPQEGEFAPEIEVPALDGPPRQLKAALEAGPVLVSFFKLECGACEVALPFIEATWRHYRDHTAPEGVSLGVWGVSQDPAKPTRELVERLGLSFDICVDDDPHAASETYQIEVTPSLILLAGREKLRRDSDTVDADQAYRVLATMEAWNREEFQIIVDEIAVRVGSLPAEPFEGHTDVPASKPG